MYIPNDKEELISTDKHWGYMYNIETLDDAVDPVRKSYKLEVSGFIPNDSPAEAYLTMIDLACDQAIIYASMSDNAHTLSVRDWNSWIKNEYAKVISNARSISDYWEYMVMIDLFWRFFQTLRQCLIMYYTLHRDGVLGNNTFYCYVDKEVPLTRKTTSGFDPEEE